VLLGQERKNEAFNVKSSLISDYLRL